MNPEWIREAANFVVFPICFKNSFSKGTRTRKAQEKGEGRSYLGLVMELPMPKEPQIWEDILPDVSRRSKEAVAPGCFGSHPHTPC